MKHPCKKCLVRAPCHNDKRNCPDWNKYSNFASSLVTAISLITGSLVMGSSLIYLKSIHDKVDYYTAVIVIWTICIFANDLLDDILKAKCGIIFKFVFAPILTWFYIILFSTKRYFKRA